MKDPGYETRENATGSCHLLLYQVTGLEKEEISEVFLKDQTGADSQSHQHANWIL